MTRDEVLAMAKERDLTASQIVELAWHHGAMAGRAAEREECAKVCEQIAGPEGLNPPGKPKSFYYTDDGYGCAGAIRARSAK